MFRRIFLGYLAVLIVSLTVLALSFSLAIRHYMINDTLNRLNREAENLSILAAQRIGMNRGGHMHRITFQLVNTIVHADHILAYKNGEIIDSSNTELYPPGTIIENQSFIDMAAEPAINSSSIGQDYVAAVYPVVTTPPSQEAVLILYSRLDLLSQLNKTITVILVYALGAAVVISLIIAMLVTRIVIDPLQKLKNRAAELTQRQFRGRLDIKTGDELEELANTFNEMTEQLEKYDLNQKSFFQQASHELKTPLMSIQGYAEALHDEVIPRSEEKAGLAIITRESERMKSLVEKFIYLSKMESLYEKNPYIPVNLKETVQEAVDAMQGLTIDRGISIKIDSLDGESIVAGDPEKIHRLFLNLIGNALRYANKNITITLNKLIIQVDDDGAGFQNNEIERVFEPFYRSDDGGSGLGLTISRAIVKEHHGLITAGNNPDGGARITIVFSSRRNP